MHLEAPVARLQKSQKDTYAFLTDLQNFEKLMPDTIETFEILDEDTFRFTLKGMPEIILKRKSQEPYREVVLGAASDKVPFTLTAQITEVDTDQSEVALIFDGQFNTMMAMMIKSPITNFIGTLSGNLSRV